MNHFGVKIEDELSRIDDLLRNRHDDCECNETKLQKQVKIIEKTCSEDSDIDRLFLEVSSIKQEIEQLNKHHDEVDFVKSKIIELNKKLDEILEEQGTDSNIHSNNDFEELKLIIKGVKDFSESTSKRVDGLSDKNLRLTNTLSIFTDSNASLSTRIIDLYEKLNSLKDDSIPKSESDIAVLFSRIESLKRSTDESISSIKDNYSSFLSKLQALSKTFEESQYSMKESVTETNRRISQLPFGNDIQEIFKTISTIRDIVDKLNSTTNDHKQGIRSLTDSFNSHKSKTETETSSQNKKLGDLENGISSVKDNLSKLSSMISMTNSSFLQKIQKLTSSIDDHSDKLDKLSSQDVSSNSNLYNFSLQVSSIADLLSTLSEKINSLKDEFDDEKGSSKDSNDSLVFKISEIIDYMESLKSSHDDLNFKVSDHDSKLFEHSSKLKELMDMFKSLQSSADSNDNRHDSFISQIIPAIQDLDMRVSNLNDRSSSSDDDITNLHSLLKSLEQSIKSQGTTTNLLVTSNADLGQGFSALSDLIEKMRDSNDHSLTDIFDKHDQLKKMLSGLDIKFSDSLSDMTSSFSGLSDSFSVLSNAFNSSKSDNESKHEKSDRRLDQHDRKFDNHSDRLNQCNDRLNQNDEQLNRHSEKLNRHDDQFDEHSGKIEQIIAALDEQINRNSQVMNILSHINGSNDETKTLKDVIDNLQGDQQTQVKSLRDLITELTSKTTNEHNNNQSQIKSVLDMVHSLTEKSNDDMKSLRDLIDGVSDKSNNDVKSLRDLIDCSSDKSNNDVKSLRDLIDQVVDKIDSSNSANNSISFNIADDPSFKSVISSLMEIRDRMESIEKKSKDHNDSNNSNDTNTQQSSEVQDLIVQMRNIIEMHNEGKGALEGNLVKNFDVVTGRNISSVSSYFTGNREEILTFGNPATFQHGLMSLREITAPSMKIGSGSGRQGNVSLDLRGDLNMTGKINGTNISDVGRTPLLTQSLPVISGRVYKIPYSGPFPNRIRIIFNGSYVVPNSETDGYLFHVVGDNIIIRTGDRSVGLTFDSTGKITREQTGNYDVQIF